MNQRDEQQRKKDAAFAAAALKVLFGVILVLAVIVAMVYSWDSIFDDLWTCTSFSGNEINRSWEYFEPADGGAA